jgi:hypothetical protein
MPQPPLREANVVIRIWLGRERSRLGEVVIAPIYYYTDGSAYEGDSHRVAVSHGTDRGIREFWDALFDEVCRVQQERPRSIRLSLNSAGMGPWRDRVTTVMRIVSHELRVPIAGQQHA